MNSLSFLNYPLKESEKNDRNRRITNLISSFSTFIGTDFEVSKRFISLSGSNEQSINKSFTRKNNKEN